MSARRSRTAVRSIAAAPDRRLLWLGALLAPVLLLLASCEGSPSAAGISSTGYGYVCHAGFYQCTLPSQVPLGTPCQCPGLGAPSYGRVG